MKKIILTILLVSEVIISIGQIKFYQQKNSDFGNYKKIDGSPGSLPRSGGVVLDFDNDGLKDFIIPSYYGPTNNHDVSYLRFFKNQGNGTFIEVTKQYVNSDNSTGLFFTGGNDGNSVVFDFSNYTE